MTSMTATLVTSAPRSLPTAEDLRRAWRDSPRWQGVRRAYDAGDVVRLRGTMPVGHSIARLTAERLWRYLNERPLVSALGALTGNQAMQQIKAGLDAIYRSGWQVAGDANLAGEMYPDQSLYPADSVPAVVRRINNTLRRADEIHHAEGDDSIDWLKPIVADAEAGFGGVLNAFELMKQMIDAGAAGPTRRTWICSGARPPSPISRRRGNSRKRSTRSSPTSSSPTTARRRSTGSAISMME